MCPAWGQTCRACGKQNHFERVWQLKGDEKRGAMRCIEDEEAAMDVLIAHIVFGPATGTYKLGNSGFEKLEATLIPFSPYPDPRRIRDIPAAHPTRLKIYPDSGAAICLGGLTHSRHMGFSERNLVLSKKRYAPSEDFPWYFPNHKAGPVYMRQVQQDSLYWCRDITSMFPQTRDIATINNMRCHTSNIPRQTLPK